MGEIVNVDGAISDALLNGRICFGCPAQGEYDSLLARWDNPAIYFLVGVKIPADEAKGCAVGSGVEMTF